MCAEKLRALSKLIVVVVVFVVASVVFPRFSRSCWKIH